MKLSLLLQLVAQVLQAEYADMGALGLTDGLLQSLMGGESIFEAKCNPQAESNHTTCVYAISWQVCKCTARKLYCLWKVQSLGFYEGPHANQFSLDGLTS